MRIHFTRADLARTHVVSGPDVMWEVVGSLQALQAGYGRRTFGQWRWQARHDLRDAGLARPVRDRLFPVTPHAAYYPDLLTPVEGGLGLDEAVDAILSTPRRRLCTEIGRLSGGPGQGAWLDDLRAARSAALAELGATVRAYHRLSIEPHWPAVRACVDSDLARRRQALREGGVHDLLNSFRPMMRWNSPVLEIPAHPSGRDVHLGGRGLVLIPSYFTRLHPNTIFDARLPQVITYPAVHPAVAVARRDVVLDRLLGDTRAAALRGVAGGSTTSELALRVGVSLPTISHHTGILRDAGLIVSRRTATTVLHTLSPLGEELLAGRSRGGHERGAG
ncbi:ArsR/SmtB family transcription factor [Nonomuraea sp. PA05]|uniref:ArsR/SmtB family transcription factor n=1 Tax=Nonomuraea sp. PA05 TaxID=2604466 RepID=UPI001652B0FE|nr:winged helix-turn-helix domain-containing protein [Nonomuraea sp. PA05]